MCIENVRIFRSPLSTKSLTSCRPDSHPAASKIPTNCCMIRWKFSLFSARPSVHAKDVGCCTGAHAANARNCLFEDENWTGMTNAIMRRTLQSRLSQRAGSKRLAKEIKHRQASYDCEVLRDHFFQEAIV
ncbi:hypothetical protein BDV96DRAFT_359125 [Lophiotrema nucula]|uniref:Uncharacterized protein n=1 Tax=Lophiotrema nucula TaxID=690887 RepID=A0A6A5YHH0_9PLEO|nr:hypothetical protein BDV96DRAFT_359125 [Lophiotrema nucula]